MGVLDAMSSSNLKPEDEAEEQADRVYRTTYKFSATMPQACCAPLLSPLPSLHCSSLPVFCWNQDSRVSAGVRLTWWLVCAVGRKCTAGYDVPCSMHAASGSSDPESAMLHRTPFLTECTVNPSIVGFKAAPLLEK